MRICQTPLFYPKHRNKPPVTGLTCILEPKHRMVMFRFQKLRNPANDGLCFGVSDKKPLPGGKHKGEVKTASEPCADNMAQDAAVWTCQHCGRPAAKGADLLSCSVSGAWVWLHHACIDEFTKDGGLS